MSQAEARYVPVSEAAALLGISVEAARKRCARGQVPAEKRLGQWWVQVEDVLTEPDPAGPAPDGSGLVPDNAALLAHLQGEIAWLRAQLDLRTDEVRRRDLMLAQERRDRMPELGSPGVVSPSPAPVQDQTEPVRTRPMVRWWRWLVGTTVLY